MQQDSEKQCVDSSCLSNLAAPAPPTARQMLGRMISTNFAYFMGGLNGALNAAAGVLIPYLQPSYHVGLLSISFIYLVNFAGWLFASFINIHVCSHIGTGGTLVMGSVFQCLGYALMFWKPPFALFMAAFFFTGMGVALQDAQANTFMITIRNPHRWLGVLHAVYGVGAVVSPIIANSIAARTRYWHFYYLITFGLGLFNTCLLAWTFRIWLFKPNSLTAKDTANSNLKATLGNKTVWILNGFFFLYVGAEVTAGGWLVQFLVSVRNGKPSQVGYVASGFWTGITLGRVALAEVTHRFGERKMVFLYIVLAAVMQLIFWLVPSIPCNAVAVIFLGFFIGPFYPVGLYVLTKVVPEELHIGAIGFTASLGQAGSAAFPFITGAVASQEGVEVLQPIMIGLFGGICIFWACIPRKR